MNRVTLLWSLAIILASGYECNAAEPGSDVLINAGDGVFTAEQAARGHDHYGQYCGACHRPDLSGGQGVPPLASDSFLRKWQGRQLQELFRQMSATMPKTAPHSLSDQVYADIVAFLLESNGFPSGTKELKPEADALSHIIIKDTIETH
jgi:mono/diheme cytochrome c family protein